MYSVPEMAERKQYRYSLPLIASLSLNPTGVEIIRQRDLCRVERRNGKYGGYRKAILKENLTEKENVLVICEICEGIMREACFTSIGEQFCSCCGGGEQSDSSIQTSNVPVRRMIDLLKCSCPLMERGCEWLRTLKDCEDHLDMCGYVRDQCTLGCGAVLQRNELKVHEEGTCPEGNVMCEHPKMDIPSKLICGEVMRRKNMAQHVEQECGFVVEMCGLGCGMEMTRNELKIHVTDKCIQRLVTCNQCFQFFNYCDITEHFELCPKMKVSCTLKCGVIMCRENVSQHLEDDCLEKEIACPFAMYNCKIRKKRKSMKKHLDKKRSEHKAMKQNGLEDMVHKLSEQNKMLCSINNTTKLEWRIQNIIDFMKDQDAQRIVDEYILNTYFLNNSICVSFGYKHDSHQSTVIAKFTICIYSNTELKVMKQYIHEASLFLIGDVKREVARVPNSDIQELSRMGATDIILEMYVTIM